MPRKKKLTKTEMKIDLSDVKCFNIKQVLYAPDIGGDFKGYSMIIFKDGVMSRDTLYEMLVAYSKEQNRENGDG